MTTSFWLRLNIDFYFWTSKNYYKVVTILLLLYSKQLWIYSNYKYYNKIYTKQLHNEINEIKYLLNKSIFFYDISLNYWVFYILSVTMCFNFILLFHPYLCRCRFWNICYEGGINYFTIIISSISKIRYCYKLVWG